MITCKIGVKGTSNVASLVANQPGGRKGRPKPSTYSEIKEAVVIGGMREGASFREIGEELGQPGQAIEHKVRRMRAQGQL